jgi:hypothetical protein
MFVNKVGGEHSLGKDLIHLSRNGIDSVSGKDGHQYIYHPIAYGPFLADKYGYPSISKLHQLDKICTKIKNAYLVAFYGKVYSIQHHVIKFVSDWRQVGGFLRALRFPPARKLK